MNDKIGILHSPIDDISSIINELRDFASVKDQLLAGNIEPVVWWMIYLLLAIIQLIFIFYLCWLIIKRQILIPDNQDKRNIRKTLIGLFLITGFQIFTKQVILYPLLNINFIF